MHYRWLAHKKGYAAAFDRAKEEAAQTLEDEAIRRAHDGVLEPKFWKGKLVGAVRVYSDALLMFMLRGARPERYRERSAVDISGSGNPISITITQADADL
jgi:hypothetical protein